jgi:SpoVK/Ycf46/Vps4 family AAA+-type ATPase
MISQLLIEMDSLKLVAEDLNKYQSNSNHQVELASRVFVLAATNCLSAIDQAFLQPGRFENVVYVGLPTPTQRRSILVNRILHINIYHFVHLIKLLVCRNCKENVCHGAMRLI